MERIIRVLFTITILISWPATAGVALVPSSLGEATDSEGFPISRFGDSPADPVRGLRADWPAPTFNADRAPAGMVFDGAAPEETGGSGAVQRPAPRDISSATEGTRRLEKDIPLSKSPSQAQPQELIPDRVKGVQEISVIAGDLGFFPKTFFVSRDVPVRLFVTGASKKPLCIMMDSFQVRRQVSAQRIEEITFTPNVPGQYRFYCPMNGMEGTMVVKELASSG